jgi:cell division protein FtsN
MKDSKYDGYAVGRRVLKIAPGWLLLCLAAFVLVFLFFGWLSRSVEKAGKSEEVFRNEATNQTAKGDAAQDLKRPAAAPSGDAPARATETGAGETNASSAMQGSDAGFSVQTGSFDERSQANEQVSRLRAAGFKARIVEKEKEKTRGVWFQVRCGNFKTREEAAELAGELRAMNLAEEIIVVEPVRQ